MVVIDDEADLRDTLTYNLEKAGFRVLAAATGTDGLHLIQEQLPALVVLDLMLPDITGTEVCKALRRNPATRRIPIVMLTARSGEIDRVVGLELGADDYVTKPFSVRELMLRIEAVLRRAVAEPGPGAGESFGRLQIDRSAHRVLLDGASIELTAVEFRLLILLFERRGRVQSRAALLEEVWGPEAEISPRTVDTHVKRLRDKLGAAGPFVETIRGSGYRFRAQPEEE